MAGSDSQKQLLSLIRNVASEKSQGERRLVGLKKQIEELKSELNAENAELEDAKHTKELVEQELKGYEVQLAMTETSIQTLEARISSTQGDISTIRSDLEALKNEEGDARDQFIHKMFELNAKIRKFQEKITCNTPTVDCVESAACEDAEHRIMNNDDAEVALSTLEDMLADIICQTTKEEEEYQAEQNIQKKVQQELIESERMVSLMDMIMEETKALQELTSSNVSLTGNKQTSQLEATYSTLGEELQKRCVCPSCHFDNMEALGGILRANEGN
ncbi:Spindle assembly checkpoint component [Quillaja saponaria]|uniref:Spindle assembly checkpoint component n=1 Tax=Quillaja saponaria TaxID=32244 RepID=A0AAD7VFZ4_QUISA|nr:Spindle assembly checkpoint component [Quillaja saponaria]KAJ7974481.1 Spindle assembly checkpoint component [Quillaja saponaria]